MMNRNLVKVETLDEFSKAIDKVDFTEEDIVGLITSLTNVFYWINIESIWGLMGFTWKTVDDYGVFNKTTIPFNIIPKVPDGERIKQFRNTFNNISSNYIEIQKSNWENLSTLYTPWKNKYVKADLTGANLTQVHDLCYFTSSDIDNPSNIPGVYIKADLSNVSVLSGSNGYLSDGTNSSYKLAVSGKFICLDDDNKGLNAPVCGGIALYWNGTGPFKLEYFFRDEAIKEYNNAYRITLYSENQQYEITNVQNSYIKICGNIYSSWDDFNTNYSIYPLEGTIPIDLTIDGTINPEIKICSWYNRQLYHSWGSQNCYWFNDIKLKNYNSIDVINPYYLVQDELPDVTEQLSKWEDSSDSAFYPYIMVKNPQTLMKCPSTYSIDASNRKWLTIFRDWRSNLTNDDWDAEELTKDDNKTIYVVDVLPEVNWEKADLLKLWLPILSLGKAYYKLPNTTIKAKSFYCSGYYIQQNTIIETGYCETFASYQSVTWYDYSNIHWKLVPLTHDDRYQLGMEEEDVNKDKLSISVGSMKEYYGVNVIKNSETNLNCVEITDEIKKDEVLHNSYINTWSMIELSNSISDIQHDLVVTGKQTCSVYRSLGQYRENKIKISSKYIYLYCNLEITTDNENDAMETSEIMKLVNGLQKLEEGLDYHVTLKKWLFEKLTNDEKEEIINKGYTLIEQI